MYILYYELIRHRYFITLSKAINTDLIFSTVKRVRARTGICELVRVMRVDIAVNIIILQ